MILPPARHNSPTKCRHRHHHQDDAQLLQQQNAAKKKGIEEALDKAKETLSNMMHETETELDEAIMSCKESGRRFAVDACFSPKMFRSRR